MVQYRKNRHVMRITVPKIFLSRRQYPCINPGRKTMCKRAASDVLNPPASIFYPLGPTEVFTRLYYFLYFKAMNKLFFFFFSNAVFIISFCRECRVGNIRCYFEFNNNLRFTNSIREPIIRVY